MFRNSGNIHQADNAEDGAGHLDDQRIIALVRALARQAAREAFATSSAAAPSERG